MGLLQDGWNRRELEVLQGERDEIGKLREIRDSLYLCLTNEQLLQSFESRDQTQVLYGIIPQVELLQLS